MTEESARREDLAALVRRAQAGDEDAFTSLVRRFQDAAVGYAWSLLGDLAAAEDAAQEAFVEVWRSLPRLRAPAAFPVWLRRIVFKRADRLRRRPRRDTLPLDTARNAGLSEPRPDELAERTDLGRRVRAALRRLTPVQRRAVVVYYFLDRGIDGTAAFLGVPSGTVKSRLAAARATLREELIDVMGDETNRMRPSRNERFERRVRLLIEAAADGEVDTVDQLLEDEPSAVSEPGPHPVWGGRPTALHTAVERGRIEVVERLLAGGADPNADSAGYDGWTPLFLAVTGGHRDIAQRLLEVGARPDAWAAAVTGDTAMLRDLLAADPALVHAQGPNRATPLHFAATLDTVRLLVERGTDLTALDKYGSTPVRTVAYSREAERPAARWLIEQSDEDDIFLRTAFGDHDAIRALLAADPALIHAHDPHLNAASARGATPLHVAATLGDASTARLLLDLGANANARCDPGGETALHYAARFGEREMVELLLARGADPRLVDDIEHATPLDWARFFEVTSLDDLLDA